MEEQVAMEGIAPESAPEPSIEDLAVHDWQTLLPEFKKQLKELSNAQLKRVVTALIEHPLEKNHLQFSYPQEKDLFQVGAKLLDCKFVIMKAVLAMSKEDINKVLSEGTTNEPVSS